MFNVLAISFTDLPVSSTVNVFYLSPSYFSLAKSLNSSFDSSYLNYIGYDFASYFIGSITGNFYGYSFFNPPKSGSFLS